jgi:peptidoglycan/xylan/chitin deacetylase (PgdA/CDA1 family)
LAWAALPSRLVLRHGPRKSTMVCLTFDDGPHPVHTPRLLDALRDYGIRATFFLVGKEAEKHPELVQRIVANGHVVGHHSYSHSDPSATTARELIREVETCDRIFRTTVPAGAALFRPPYGKLTFRKMAGLWQAGKRIVLWSVDPKDYACDSDAALASRLKSIGLRGGDIVLLHDVHPHAAGALPELVAMAARANLGFATVDGWIR